MTWLEVERTELAAERILDAAAQLFVEQGVGQPGMADIAAAAGCSRATVYRYFDSKPALLQAFVHREAQDITRVVTVQLTQLGDQPGSRAMAVEAVVATLAAVRDRPYLQVWYDGHASVVHRVFRDSPVIATLASTFGRPERAGADVQFAEWVLRIVLSFLREPGESPEQERRLLDRFLLP